MLQENVKLAGQKGNSGNGLVCNRSDHLKAERTSINNGSSLKC